MQMYISQSNTKDATEEIGSEEKVAAHTKESISTHANSSRERKEPPGGLTTQTKKVLKGADTLRVSVLPSSGTTLLQATDMESYSTTVDELTKDFIAGRPRSAEDQGILTRDAKRHRKLTAATDGSK